jgi:hypothetical protein
MWLGVADTSSTPARREPRQRLRFETEASHNRGSGIHGLGSGVSRRATAFGEASQQIARGAAPESVGLPNIGIPDPVPILHPETLSHQAAASIP